jgi:alcohol dehydrogenase
VAKNFLVDTFATISTVRDMDFNVTKTGATGSAPENDEIQNADSARKGEEAACHANGGANVLLVSPKQNCVPTELPTRGTKNIDEAGRNAKSKRKRGSEPNPDGIGDDPNDGKFFNEECGSTDGVGRKRFRPGGSRSPDPQSGASDAAASKKSDNEHSPFSISSSSPASAVQFTIQTATGATTFHLQFFQNELNSTIKNYSHNGDVLFGPGAIQLLSTKLVETEFSVKKALIVTSKGCVKRIFSGIEPQLGQVGVDCVMFDEILPNPTDESVEKGVSIAKENKVGFIIGIGGGSSIDAAKAIAIGVNTRRPLPIVAIPTTAGTGSEVNEGAVITFGKSKRVVSGALPRLVIVDPELMLSVPKDQTMYQGFDALCHCVESFLSASSDFIYFNSSGSLNDTGKKLLQSVPLIANALPMVVVDGNNISARTAMAFVSTSAGKFESMGLLIHDIAHVLGGEFGVTHGEALMALSVPFYTKFAQKNASNKAVTSKMVELAKRLGKSDATRAEHFVEALQELAIKCGFDLSQVLKGFVSRITRPSASKILSFAALSKPNPTYDLTPGNFKNEDYVWIFEQLWPEDDENPEDNASSMSSKS